MDRSQTVHEVDSFSQFSCRRPSFDRQSIVNKNLAIANRSRVRLGTVSYSPSIVIMAVYVGILEIFSVKEWPDLEIWVWGRSRSLKMARFERHRTVYKQGQRPGRSA